MNRAEFMEKLRALLADVEQSEREEALNYYEDYFDDAGDENEQSVIAALGSPERVASIIKEGLKDEAGTQGEFSETGFSGYGDTGRSELGYHKAPGKQKLSDRFKNPGTGGWILILILAIFALPILGPILIGIAATIFGVFVAVIAVLVALAFVGIVLIVGGVSVFTAAIGTLFVTPAAAIMLFGVALLLVGIGILITIFGIWIIKKTVPPVIRWIVKLLRKPFERKGV